MSARIDPTWVEAYFNLACATAMQGKIEISLAYVEMILKKDRVKVIAWVKNDSDLAALRKESRYMSLVKLYDPQNHWVNEVLNTKFIYSLKSSWDNDHLETELRGDGTVEASGRISNTVPCGYRYTGGNWLFDGIGVAVIIYFEGGCAGSEEIKKDSRTYNPKTKGEFLDFFSKEVFPGSGDFQK